MRKQSSTLFFVALSRLGTIHASRPDRSVLQLSQASNLKLHDHSTYAVSLAPPLPQPRRNGTSAPPKPSRRRRAISAPRRSRRCHQSHRAHIHRRPLRLHDPEYPCQAECRGLRCIHENGGDDSGIWCVSMGRAKRQDMHDKVLIGRYSCNGRLLRILQMRLSQPTPKRRCLERFSRRFHRREHARSTM